jgi:hypothetical protein
VNCDQTIKPFFHKQQINNEMQATIKSLTKQRDEVMNLKHAVEMLLEDSEMTNNNLKKQVSMKGQSCRPHTI